MRDLRFKAERLGGLLKPEEHKLLINWALQCIQHICPLLHIEISQQINQILVVARKWSLGNATVKEARNAAIAMNELAKITTNLTDKFGIKAAGHTLATAHMADHAVVASKYAIKAFQNINNSVKSEIEWQINQLPIEIKEFMIKTLLDKTQDNNI